MLVPNKRIYEPISMRNKMIEEDLAKIIEDSNLPWSDFENKTVLITGANGFLPAYMIETLLFLNERRNINKTRVLGLVRNRERASLRFKHYQNRSDFEMIVQDVCDPLSIQKKKDIHYIIHAASQASPKYYGKDPVGTILPNVLGTYNLLNLAKDKKVKDFLFFSSSEIYGQVDSSKMPIKEDTCGFIDPMDVRSCYAESKRMGETMCVSWFHLYGVPVKIIRPFHTYGPGMRLDDGRVYADFINDIVNNRDIVMKSDGSAIRAFCYVADAVAGFFTVLLKGKIGHAYNISNDRCEISILDLANKIISLFPEKKLKTKRLNSVGDKNYLQSKVSRTSPDISKVRNLGWYPDVSIAQGFKRTIRSFLCE